MAHTYDLIEAKIPWNRTQKKKNEIITIRKLLLYVRFFFNSFPVLIR